MMEPEPSSSVPAPTTRTATPARLVDHPTVRAVRARAGRPPDSPADATRDTAALGAGKGDTATPDATSSPPPVLDADELTRLCLDCGADDVGFVDVDHPSLVDDRRYIDEVMPGIRTLVGFVVRTSVDAVRSPARATANLEFHTSYDMVDQVGRRIARRLQDRGHRAVNPSAGFPQEMSRFPDHAWSIPHKRVAVAAGLGQMGIHRNVIHPRFGNFVVLGTVALQAEVTSLSAEIDFNPCLECKLCVAACPVGAISNDGDFDFFGCYNHNYREFMSGFVDWVQTIADSEDAADYRSRVPDHETVSMWQSLSFKADYKAAYCVAVCPAGEEVIGPWLHDRRRFTAEVVRPLQHKEERIYAAPGSHAAEYARKRFPHKTVVEIDPGLVPPEPAG